MRRTSITVSLILASLALVWGCSEHPSTQQGAAAFLRGGNLEGVDDGFTLAADPAEVVIDLGDEATPVDPANDKHYGETTLTAIALDELGMPQEGMEVTFASSAGTLASAGAPVTTDGAGTAQDTLRLFEDDPASVEVTATAGERSETIAVALSVIQPNEPPVADAGPDMTIECASGEGTVVRLDGSASSDPDGEIVRYEWLENFGQPDEVSLGEGVQLDTTLGLGVHTITLRVTDSSDETATDEVVVTIEDTTPPMVDLMLDPSVLWPPNHELVPIHASLRVTDCSPTTVRLVSVESSESPNGTGDGNTEPDIVGASMDGEDYEFQLRAERAGGGSGRIYTVVYRVTDDQGNAAEKTAEVRVPHDQGH